MPNGAIYARTQPAHLAAAHSELTQFAGPEHSSPRNQDQAQLAHWPSPQLGSTQPAKSQPGSWCVHCLTMPFSRVALESVRPRRKRQYFPETFPETLYCWSDDCPRLAIASSRWDPNTTSRFIFFIKNTGFDIELLRLGNLIIRDWHQGQCNLSLFLLAYLCKTSTKPVGGSPMASSSETSKYESPNTASNRVCEAMRARRDSW